MKIKMNNKVVISVENITKKYALYNSKNARLKEALSFTRKKYHREHKALDDVSFEVRKGECLAVVGKNGSGKSTLLQIIAGLMQPTRGSVKVRGRVSALVQLGATFNPEFSGLENVNLYATAMGYSPREIKAKLPEILRFADIDGFVNQKVKTYSSGMRARLAFSVIVCLKPEILIIDEVLSVGDMFFKQKCINKLKQMIENGLTLFFVSHSLNDVKSLCKKALYLDKGKVIAFGDVNEVTTLYQHNNTMKQSEDDGVKANKVVSPAHIACQKNVANPRGLLDKLSSHRAGTCELEFMDVMLCDTNGQEISTVLPNENFQIKITIMANDDVLAGSNVGILIRNQTGHDVGVVNSDFYNKYLPSMKKGQTLIYIVEILCPMNSGNYSISLGIRPRPDSSSFYDQVFNALPFEMVLPKNIASRTGIIYLEPSKIEMKML